MNQKTEKQKNRKTKEQFFSFSVPSFFRQGSSSVARQGFTLVELLIAMTLFITVIGISAGSFVQILRTQRMTVALIAANNNAVLTLEEITREIRTGQHFSMQANGDTDDFLFTNAQGQTVTYHWDSAAQALEKSIDGVTFKKLTADNVLVTRASFRIFQDPAGKSFPPRITILLAVGATGLPFTTPAINLEMTVSSRALQ